MPVDTNLRLAENEQIIDFYEALRRHALSAFDKDSVSLEMLRNKGFLSWAQQQASSLCQCVSPTTQPIAGNSCIDDELKALLTDLALRSVT